MHLSNMKMDKKETPRSRLFAINRSSEELSEAEPVHGPLVHVTTQTVATEISKMKSGKTVCLTGIIEKIMKASDANYINLVTE